MAALQPACLCCARIEIGGHLVEGHPGLAGHRLGDERLAVAGPPLQQHALGRPRHQRAILLRLLEELQGARVWLTTGARFVHVHWMPTN